MMHKVQREITQKIQKAELPFLHPARHLMLIDICIKFREYSLSGFQVIERTQFVTDRQTDGQTDARGKTICLPTLKGGDIISIGSNSEGAANGLVLSGSTLFVKMLLKHFNRLPRRHTTRV